MSGESEGVIRRYYDALNDRNLEAFEEVVAPGLIVESSGSTLDFAAFQNMLRHYILAFPDLHHEIRQLVQEERHLAVLTETTGTHLGIFLGHPPTARSFRALGIDLVEIDDHKVGRIRSVFDSLGMLSQLGLYKPAVGESHG